MKQKNYPLYEPAYFTDFRDMLEKSAERYPEKNAFEYKNDPHQAEPTTITYPEMRDFVVNYGTGLVDLGCRDNHVAIVGESSFGWIASYYALMATGAVTVPIDKELPVDDIKGIINKAKCKAVVYSEAAAEKINAIKAEIPTVELFICTYGEPTVDGALKLDDIVAKGAELRANGDNSYYDYEIDPDRLATIVFTSGTTGKGKGVMLSQGNLASDMIQGMYNFAITGRTLAVLPPHHTFCSTVVFEGHYALGSTICISNGLRYILNELKEYKPSHLILVPLFVETFYKRIWASAEKSGRAGALKALMKASDGMRKVGIDMRRKLFKEVLDNFGGKLELIICGGAALKQEIIDTFDSLGVTIMNGYGITECAPLISANRNKYQKKGSVGVPNVGLEVKILDPDENGEGEICVKGPNVMLGYYEDPEATAAVFDEDGFFKTGDYGKLDDEGWIYITGRLKNLIIFSNGKNVYPEEIELEISNIPGVNEVVVYAGESRANPEKEVIVAEIYPDFEALDAKGITDYKRYFTDQVKEINQRMVSYKAVGLVKIRKEEFQKNTSKKIVRYSIDKAID